VKLKTGSIDNVSKAISTTNLRMSYQSNNKNQNRDEHREKLREELSCWKNETIIRILICTAQDNNISGQYNKVADCLSKETRTSEQEYFILCGKVDTEIFFGETFARIAEAMNYCQNITKLIEIRSKKRGSSSGDMLSAKKARR
jgi:Trm5-related predicted tRNA methylase